MDDLVEATSKKTPVSSPKKTPNHNGIFAQRSCPEGKKRGDGDPAPRGRKEERCKFCGGTPRVFNYPKNRHRKPTDHDVLVQAPTVKVEPLDPTPPGPPASEGQRVDRRGSYRSDRDAVGHFTGNFTGYDATGYLPEAPAPPKKGRKEEMEIPPRRRRGEKRRWRWIYSSRAVGGDGGHHAAVPNIDPGGQQRPEVIGTFCGRGPGPLSLVAPESAFLIGGDTSLSTLRSGRFRPASEDRRRSYRSNRDRFKKSINARL